MTTEGEITLTILFFLAIFALANIWQTHDDMKRERLERANKDAFEVSWYDSLGHHVDTQYVGFADQEIGSVRIKPIPNPYRN